MTRKRSSTVEAAAAAAAAAVAASQGNNTDILPLDDDPETAELAEDVLEGLRRLDSGGNRVTWYVYSETPGVSGASEGYIEKLRSEQLDESRFKSVYGPGEYRIIGRTKDGAYVKGSHKVIRISDIGATNSRHAPATDAVTLLREMRATEEAARAKRAEDMRAYAQILAAPLATLGAALIARRPSLDIAALVTALRPQQSTLTEMTTALMNLKQLEGGGGSNVDMILKVLERVQDLPMGAGGDTGWLGFVRDLVREAAPHAREILGTLNQQQSRPGVLPQGATSGAPFGPGVASLPGSPNTSTVNGTGAVSASPISHIAPSSSYAVESSGTATTDESNMWKQLAEPWLRKKAEELHEAASTNMPVELEAERLVIAAKKKFGALVSDTDLKQWLEYPQWWEHVVAFYAPLQPYQAWLDDLRQEVLALLEEKAPPENDE